MNIDLQQSGMHRTFARLSVAWLTLVGMCSVAAAQTSYPMLMSIKPVAAQTGQTSEHTVYSRYDLSGAYAVLISGEGVTAEIRLPEMAADEKKKKPLQELKIDVTVTHDALPGVRDIRIATPRGMSTVGQLVIARDPIVYEIQVNNDLATAELITLPATVCGVFEKNEDTDLFRFHVDQPTTMQFHVRSMRLQDRIHDLQKHSDPILTLRNASGATLAASDNVYAADAFLSYEFEQADDYFLEIRDVRYQGNRYWEYCITVNDRPFVTTIHPLAIARGNETELNLIGQNLNDAHQSRLLLSSDVSLGPQNVVLPLDDGSSNPVAVVVRDQPAQLETSDENNSIATAQPVAVPGGVSGRIESEADLECFEFTAKKGERFSFEVFARRQQSALDPFLRILNADGKKLVENDDLRRFRRRHADSLIENWAAPADGQYIIEIRDMHLRGGDAFVYHIEATRAEPYFELHLDTDKTQLTPGTSGVLFVNVVRKNGFTAAVDLQIDGLPPGVSADCGRILPGKSRDGCIILTADNAAESAFSRVVITGRATHLGPDGQQVALTATAIPYQETYLPGGGRGHWPVESHVVAIGGPGDLRSVILSDYDVVLKPGESKKIEVVIERAPGFDKNVQLDPLFQHLSSVYGNSLPPGVTLDRKNSKTLLTGTETTGYLTFVAAKNAATVERQMVSVMANISINFVMKATYSSRPLWISVAPSD